MERHLVANIPACAEADVLIHYYIRYLHHHCVKTPVDRILIRKTNDRDHMVILTSPLDPELAVCVLWTKRTIDYMLMPQSRQVLPKTKRGPSTGIPFERVDELIRVSALQHLMGGATGTRLWSTALAFFLTGGDYCDKGPGMTSKAIVDTALRWKQPFLVYHQLDITTGGLLLDLTEYARYITAVYAASSRSHSKAARSATTLARATLDALYSVAYYSGAFAADTCPSRTGPDIAAFGQTITAAGGLEAVGATSRLQEALEPLFSGQASVPSEVFVYSWTLMPALII